jgi:hypothetical protein
VDGPEVPVEAMASGAMFHPCGFFNFAFCKECGLGTTQLSGKDFFPPKEQDPVFNLDSLT